MKFFTAPKYNVVNYGLYLMHGKQMSICMSLLSTPAIFYNWMWTYHRISSYGKYSFILTLIRDWLHSNAMISIDSHAAFAADG